MKKFLLAGLLFSITALGFSQNRQDIVQESWMTFGFEVGSYFENYKFDGDSYSDYTLSPGTTFNAYNFRQNSGVGIFARMSLLFPAYISSKKDGAEQDDSRGDYSIMMQMAMLVGPAFKFSVSNRADFYFGLGIGFMLSGGDASDDNLKQLSADLSAEFPGSRVTSASIINLSNSLGLDLGFKVDLTNMVFINVGTSATWEFLNTKEFSMDFQLSGIKLSTSESMTVTSAFNIRPYICIGFNRYAKYQMETGWGRAPKDLGPQ